MKKLWILFFIILFLPQSSQGAFFTKQPENATETSKGYVGKLPDLTKEHEPSQPAISTPIFDKTKEFNSTNQVKPIPRDNPAFVNIILKQDKTSPYISDLQEFIEMLEQIYDSIEEKENVQRFAARVYFFNKNAEYFRDKYSDKPESNYISYEKLLELSSHAKSISDLRSDAEKYKHYLTYSGSGAMYNSNKIDEQLDYLKNEIKLAIEMLKDAK